VGPYIEKNASNNPIAAGIILKNCTFWDTTPYSLLKPTDVSEKHVASTFRVAE
jgi:hypothetical protein